jgi:hypothetical protein
MSDVNINNFDHPPDRSRPDEALSQAVVKMAEVSAVCSL